MRHKRIVALASLLFCTCEAAADSGSGERVLQSFARCRAIAADAARLDCLDKAAAALEAAVAAKDVRIVDRQDIRAARRSLFGFTVPRLALFGGGSKDDKEDKAEAEEFTEINSTVVSAHSVANGRVEMRVAEGDAVWVTTDPMAFPPKPGAKVRIRKGALGNYFIAVDGERSVRGMRLR